MDSFGEFPSEATVGVLTPEDIARAREEARKKVQAALHAERFKAELEAAERQYRIELGLVENDKLPKPPEQTVRITLNLPEAVTPIPALVVDNKAFYDSMTYTLPFSLAQQLFHMQAEAWVLQARQEGKWIDRRGRNPVAMSMKTGEVSRIGAL